jgi:membrane-bound serine protease (ClpP class)
MAFVVGLLLAIFVLPRPWGIAAVVGGALIEVAEGWLGIKWTQRRRAQVGAEALIGKTARVVVDCTPAGQVTVKGERWQAHSEPDAHVGEDVVIEGVQGLTLRVRPA